METKEAERLLKLITDSIDQGKDFVLEQAPDIVQQLILFKRIEYSICASMVVILMVVSIYKCYFAMKRMKNKTVSFSDRQLNEFVVLASGGTTVLSSIVTFILLHLLLKVWFAPKVFLLEYLASLIK